MAYLAAALAGLSLALGVGAGWMQYRRFWRGRLGLKGAASLCFCLAALAAGGSPALLWAMALGFAGDVLLALPRLLPAARRPLFLGGVASFALGHGAYLALLLPLAPSPLFALGCLPGLGLAAALVRGRWCAPPASLLPWLMGYAAVLGAMGGAALGAAVGQNTPLFALAGLSFLVSDGLLARKNFPGGARVGLLPVWVALFYYAAQNLLALSPLWVPGSL